MVGVLRLVADVVATDVDDVAAFTRLGSHDATAHGRDVDYTSGWNAVASIAARVAVAASVQLGGTIAVGQFAVSEKAAFTPNFDRLAGFRQLAVPDGIVRVAATGGGARREQAVQSGRGSMNRDPVAGAVVHQHGALKVRRNDG